MKLLKLFLFTALIVATTANANTKETKNSPASKETKSSATQKTAKSSTSSKEIKPATKSTTKEAASKETKPTPAITNMPTIENALAITVKNREMVIDTDGRALSQFKYVLVNKSPKPIINIQWVSVYEHNRQVIYNQDMQIELETPIQPNQSITLNLQIPFVKIEEKYRPIFMNGQEKINVYKIARIIQFSDKQTLTER